MMCHTLHMTNLPVHETSVRAVLLHLTCWRKSSGSHGSGRNSGYPQAGRPRGLCIVHMALGSTQSPIQWVLGVKRQEHEADHSPPTSAEVNKTWIYTSTPPYQPPCSPHVTPSDFWLSLLWKCGSRGHVTQPRRTPNWMQRLNSGRFQQKPSAGASNSGSIDGASVRLCARVLLWRWLGLTPEDSNRSLPLVLPTAAASMEQVCVCAQGSYGEGD
jgi:hypothetical protein